MAKKINWNFQECQLNGRQVYKILDIRIKKYIKKKVASYWNSNNINSFPFPNPVSIERKNLSELKDYCVCAKLDGERYALYITDIPNKINHLYSKQFTTYCLLINRKYDIYIINQNIRVKINETLIDGELMDNGAFVCHDIISTMGKNVMKLNYLERYDNIKCFLTKLIQDFPQNTFKIISKKIFPISNVEDCYIQNKNFQTDGLIFYPINLPVGFKTQYTLFKWKPRTKHTIDFQIKNSIFYIYDAPNRKMVDYCKDPTFGPKYNNTICEFAVKERIENENEIEFKFVKIRTDKTNPNTLFTAEKTIFNFIENIKIEEFFGLFS